MGKRRNAVRNPGLTATDLRFSSVGDTLMHEGWPLSVLRTSGSGNVKTWTLISSGGVEYSATVGLTGAVSIGVTTRVAAFG